MTCTCDLCEHPTAQSALIWEGAPPASVHAAFRYAAERFADRPFLAVLPETAKAYGIPAGEITYGAAAEAVTRLTYGLRRAGYGRGLRVGLLLENRPAFFLTWFALNSLGVSVVPINPDLRAAELEYLISHSEVCAVVAIPARQADIRAAAAVCGRDVKVFGPGDAPPVLQFDVECARPSRPEDECAVLYTSGTTGMPKGCILSNAYFLLCAEWYPTLGGLCAMRPGVERMLTPLPVFHMNAMATSAMAMLGAAGCLIVLDRFHPSTWWESVRRSQASIVHYLGVMPAMLMARAEERCDRVHAVRFGFGAGAPKELHGPFEARFGFPLVEAWAMTETGSGGVIACADEPRHVGKACFGRPGPKVDVRLVDDAGAPVDSGRPGELLVRRAGADPRAGFFSGYLKDPEATADAWAGGWLHTGDLVRQGPDGSLYFVDRKKNVIRRSGENISAVEVEAVLMRHPAVRNVAVGPTPDALRGDEVAACVIAEHPPATAAERERLAHELVRWCLSQLAYFKAPGYVAFLDALPLTATQKVQRGALKGVLAEAVKGPACVDTRALKKRQA